ncbi:MAG: DNA recombination protein RmuC [Patescibacteria group bacterium]
MEILFFIAILAALAIGVFLILRALNNRPKDEGGQSLFDLQKQTIEGLREDVKNHIDSFTQKVNQFEAERGKQYGDVGAKVKEVLDVGTKMRDATNALETAISSGAATKGDWGQRSLRNILENSSLIKDLDFKEQETITGEEGSQLRPDFIIYFPGDGNLKLAIDAKASFDDYLKATKEKDPNRQKEYIEKFVGALRLQAKKLSTKEYQKYLDDKVPYVVMFIPSEAAMRAALEHDPELFEDAQKSKVILTSPTTLVPLVLLIAHAWKQYKAMLNAEQLRNEFVEFGDRLEKFFEHIGGIHDNLEETTKKFNAAVGSFERMIRPKIEKIKELGSDIQGTENIKKVETTPRIPEKGR